MSADRPQGCHQSQRLEEGGGSTCQRAQRWLQTRNLNVWHQVKAFCPLCWLGYKPLARLLRYLERVVYPAAPDKTFPTATKYISHIHLIKEPSEPLRAASSSSFLLSNKTLSEEGGKMDEQGFGVEK